jgi:hypothetical protein
MSAKSCPEQKTEPFAASMTARVSGWSPAARKAAINSRICASESAFRRSGRFMVMVAIPAAAETCTCSYPMAFPTLVSIVSPSSAW